MSREDPLIVIVIGWYCVSRDPDGCGTAVFDEFHGLR